MMKSDNVKKCALVAVLVSLVAFCAQFSYAAPPFQYKSVHNSSDMITNSCRICHAGSKMNRSITDTCMQCHGDTKELKRSEKKRLVSPRYRSIIKLKDLDLRKVFKKDYRHPVGEASGVHVSYEELPEVDPRKPRHVECADCHHPHYMSSDKKFAALKGVNKEGQYDVFAKKEYEVCFACHSDSANVPIDHTNKRMEFDENNPSFHPVVAEGASSVVPSLIKPYVERYQNAGDISIIKCSDCHNNDDNNGPRGPHGSDYPYILAKEYSMKDEIDERPQKYELCYGCHKRSSILGDVSFKYHSLHIRTNIALGIKGTSCFTCHDAHGSQDYTHLIRFNEDVVFRNPSTLEIKFVDKGQFQGECSLMCHGVNHNPKSY